MEIKVNTNQMSEVGGGSNVLAAQVDGHLILVIDLSKDLGLSSTGKMRAIGNTGGFQPLPGGLRGNIYIGKKA